MEHLVYGTYRRASSANFWRIEELGIRQHPNLRLVEYDLTDAGTSLNLIARTEPDEVYNLAAQSFVGVSFEQPTTPAYITGLGALNLLEAIRILRPKTRFYQAPTSERFGHVQAVPQDENTPFYPRSPYGAGKVKLGELDCIELGNLDARRDWGYAEDYVEGMYQMLQAPAPETFVLSTNCTETARDFATMTFQYAGIAVDWKGQGVDETGVDTASGKTVVRINPKFYRPAEVELLIGNPTKARDQLGWQSKTSLEELCQMMVAADLCAATHLVRRAEVHRLTGSNVRLRRLIGKAGHRDFGGTVAAHGGDLAHAG